MHQLSALSRDWVPALSSLSLSGPPALGIQQLCTLEITLGNMHNLFWSLHKCIVHINTVYCTWHCTWYVACWIEPYAIGRVFCGVLCWQNTPGTICKNSVGNISQVSAKGGFNTSQVWAQQVSISARKKLKPLPSDSGCYTMYLVISLHPTY